jgi:hypothetical protein
VDALGSYFALVYAFNLKKPFCGSFASNHL